MSAEHTVTFPIANRMFGLDSLAKRLNALVSDGQIRDWHPGRWIDWGHTAIRITFDSIEDATLAKTLCLQHTTASHPQLMRLGLAPTATAPERDGDQ